MSKKKKAVFDVEALRKAFNQILESYGKQKWKITYSVSISAEPIPEAIERTTEA